MPTMVYETLDGVKEVSFSELLSREDTDCWWCSLESDDRSGNRAR
jgi:hypothetical protein